MRHDDQQIDIGIVCWDAVRVGTEQHDLLRCESAHNGVNESLDLFAWHHDSILSRPASVHSLNKHNTPVQSSACGCPPTFAISTPEYTPSSGISLGSAFCTSTASSASMPQ